jgi:hypothetical protein
MKVESLIERLSNRHWFTAESVFHFSRHVDINRTNKVFNRDLKLSLLFMVELGGKAENLIVSNKFQ